MLSANERLRELRNALGLSQRKFAERVGIAPSYLAGMETGERPLNDRTIRLIGMEFNADEHWLRSGDGSMYNDEEATMTAKVISMFKSLSPQFQKHALSQLSVFVELYEEIKNNPPSS